MTRSPYFSGLLHFMMDYATKDNPYSVSHIVNSTGMNRETVRQLLSKYPEWFSIANKPAYPTHYYFSGDPVKATGLLDRLTPITAREPVATNVETIVNPAIPDVINTPVAGKQYSPEEQKIIDMYAAMDLTEVIINTMTAWNRTNPGENVNVQQLAQNLLLLEAIGQLIKKRIAELTS